MTRMRAHLKGEPPPDGRMVVVVRANVSSVLGITGGEVVPCKICQRDGDYFDVRSGMHTTYLL